MSPPAKKRNTTATTKKKKATTLTSLPYDLLLNCFARVSRLYYPTLSLVSKSFRSLLASPELYKTRSLLGHTESCLYVCFVQRSYSGTRWFTLCLKPGKKKEYVLARVPIPDSPLVDFSGLVAVCSSIYSITIPSSVSVLDCRSHTWREAPSMPVQLMSFSASVLDRKIYVAGISSSYLQNLIEVFDTKTQIWDQEPIPCSETYDGFYDKTASIDGKFHLVYLNKEVAAYNSNEGRWDKVKRGMGDYMRLDSYCEIANVLYSAYDGVIRWYDTEVNNWRELNGLVRGQPNFLSKSPLTCVRLTDYGGKMVVMWNGKLYQYGGFYYNLIWCAEIALERRNNGEMWGKVEWSDHVLTVPSYDLVKVLAVTV